MSNEKAPAAGASVSDFRGLAYVFGYRKDDEGETQN
jgi:hypothetical protein